MKKILFSLLTLAAALSVTSCLKDIEGGAAYGDGDVVDATFSVVLGPQTKAFADGTTVDKLYAGIYEIGANNAYTWAADNADAPVAISSKAATVTFNGKIELGKSYKVVFWAQKEGAPYAIDWAKTATTGPIVTVTATGNANDENRDAFYGVYETGTVTGAIDLTGSPVSLKRPFAQVNVLVPNTNFADPTVAISSSMAVNAPTKLNLVTKETSDAADWSLVSAAISEAAFGSYASTHKYVAMNYVLVDQDATADARYNISFSVIAGTQSLNNKALANIPLKPNGRTNIVGNIFATNFDITVPVIIDPATQTDQELTTVTVTVGQDEANAVALAYSSDSPVTTSIEVAVSHAIEADADLPQITVEPASVATAAWNLTTGKLDVTPLVENGSALITLVFPAVTKTEYSAATAKIYVKVGNGQNPAPTTPTKLVMSDITCTNSGESENSLTFTWDEVANATGYMISTDGGGIFDDAQTGCTYNLTGLDAGTAYTIHVKAVGDNTNYETSDAKSASGTTKAAPALYLTADPATATVAANVESVTWSISSNTSWAIDASDGVTVTPRDGTGDHTVELTFGKNEATTARTITATAKATGCEDVTITITQAGLAQTPTYDFTTVAALKALTFTTATEYKGTLTGAVVSFVPAANTAIIKDDTGSILLYKKDHGLLQGQTISGEVTVTTDQYNGGNQIKALTATVSGAGAVVEPQTVALAAIVENFSLYECAYVKVTGLNVTAVSGKNVTVSDGTNSFVVYNNPGNATCGVGDVVTAVGTVTRNNTTDEIKVWSADGLIVTSSAPKAITFSQPASGGSFTVSVDSNNITSGTTVASGKTVTLTATATSDFTFAGWTVSGATVADAAAATTTFEMGSSAVTISASFTSSGGGTSQTVTMQYTGGTTTNMTGNNDAATFGLDANKWSVVGGKGANSNFPGLNKANDFRLYWSDGGSNTITVSALESGAKINSIAITYTGDDYSNGKVLVGDNAVSESDGAYPINSTSFVITNGNTSNVQVRIKSIVINYTTGN